MPKDVRIVVDYQGSLRSFVWASLQDDGSISVGFSDRSFLVPGFTAERELDGAVHRSQVDLVTAHGAKAVTNPHFTFHPPGYVHLRANGHNELFAGLLMIDLMVEQDGRVPWIRFISNPVDTLAPYSRGRSADTTDIFRLLAPSGQCSVELAVDFVAPGAKQVRPAAPFEAHLEWQSRLLHLYAHHHTPRRSTLSWNHSS